MNTAYIWRATQERLRQKTTSAQFETWLRGTQLLSLTNGRAVLGAPTTFAREQLETRFRPLIETTLSEVAGSRCTLAIEVIGSAPTEPTGPTGASHRPDLFTSANAPEANVTQATAFESPPRADRPDHLDRRGQRSVVTTPLNRQRPLPTPARAPSAAPLHIARQGLAPGMTRNRGIDEGGGRGAATLASGSIGTGGVSALWGASPPASRDEHGGATDEAPSNIYTSDQGYEAQSVDEVTSGDGEQFADDGAVMRRPAEERTAMGGYEGYSGSNGASPSTVYNPYGIAAPRLNARYTFSTFIVGSGNRMAHAASQAVAEAPGYAYNPLFLYGGVGLGKTHLLHAIGHTAVENNLVVLYVSSETFTNEIVNAILHRTTEEFRAKYRSVDVLLVDDIQFIAGKDSTEEEFFHTFNSLHEANKQIVICSDRPPKAIVSLEDRLRSRFEWGLIADIQPPDLETRIAILRAKTELTSRPIPDDVLLYLASHVQSNIRELEGSLNRLLAYATLQGAPLSVETAKAALASLASDGRQRRVSVGDILDAVAEHYHIPQQDLCGKQRDKHIV
ncbi:MAG TPA: chromosomal replication initiator protein DnaA, partial [Ktedonobacterales bacterium]|nr:chromosomal replication initiator protein DnaA [Ktedonobacterales bacterium]